MELPANGDSSAPFFLLPIPKCSRPRPAFHVSPLLSSEVNSRRSWLTGQGKLLSVVRQ